MHDHYHFPCSFSLSLLTSLFTSYSPLPIDFHFHFHFPHSNHIREGGFALQEEGVAEDGHGKAEGSLNPQGSPIQRLSEDQGISSHADQDGGGVEFHDPAEILWNGTERKEDGTQEHDDGQGRRDEGSDIAEEDAQRREGPSQSEAIQDHRYQNRDDLQGCGSDATLHDQHKEKERHKADEHVEEGRPDAAEG